MSKRRFAFRRMKAALASPSEACTMRVTAPLLTNAVKHGLTAKSVLLPGEDPAALKALADTFLDTHRPATDEEFLLVEELVANKWRIRRMWESEQSVVRTEMLRQKQVVEAEFQGAESDILYAVALQKLTGDSKVLAHIHRQEVRYTRAADRALDQLRIAQTLRREQQREQQNVENLHTPDSPAPEQPTNVNEINDLTAGNTKIQINPKPSENYPQAGASSSLLERRPDQG